MSQLISRILITALTFFVCSVSANPIYVNDFQSGKMNEWLSDKKSGNKIEISTYQQNKTLLLKQSAFTLTPVDTTGYKNTRYSATIYGLSLEGDDECRAEVSIDGGKNWENVARLVDGQDDGYTPVFGNLVLNKADNRKQVLFRLASTGGESNDSCYFDDIKVIGEKKYDLDHAKFGKDGFSSNFINSLEVFSYPVKTSFFEKPDIATEALNHFEGALLYTGDELHELYVIDDIFFSNDISGRNKINQLPAFSIDLIQSKDDLIPAKRGPQVAEHPYWEIMFEPGKVWNQDGDDGFSRAALPFSLQQKGANCIHNGLMTFLYKNNGEVSRVLFQIGNETCAYFKFDMFGSFQPQFKSEKISNNKMIISSFQDEKANRLPTKPITQLGEKYSGADITGFGSVKEVHPSMMTSYGIVIDGVHFVSDCNTRFGSYPYCDVMDLPSYSTAKSINALAYMHVAKVDPAIKGQTVATLVPACNGKQWQDVTIENTLDMATGNFISDGFEVDEYINMNSFFDSNTHKGKIKTACKFKRKSKPGSKWVYHTTDTYLYGTLLNNYWKNKKGDQADYYQDVLVPFWDKLNLSPLMSFTRRTYDDRQQPYAGYGLTYHRNDIAKLASSIMINEQNEAMLKNYFDIDALKLAMQMDESDRGLTALENINYKYSFWALNVKQMLGCKESTWVPFMSGYGGITVALMPNNIVYYYFSDNHDYRWQEAVKTTHAIRPLCR